MQENPFKPGDLVALKSGSPAMTVDTSSSAATVCYWYNQYTHQIEKRNFPTVILTLAGSQNGTMGEDVSEEYNEDE